METHQKPPNDRAFLVYNAPGMQSHPDREPRDLLKVLVRNPKEVLVFWEISQQSFQRVLQGLGGSQPQEIGLKLLLKYKHSQGEGQDWYDLHPLSNAYYAKFLEPVSAVRAEVFVTHKGKISLFMETQGGDLPPRGPAKLLDPQWIHPIWRKEGQIQVLADGSAVLEKTPEAWKEYFDAFEGSFEGSSPSSSWGQR